MTGKTKLGGRPVLPRRYRDCFECQETTVQWLVSVRTSSPGSYRGTRLFQNYRCSECGEIQI